MINIDDKKKVWKTDEMWQCPWVKCRLISWVGKQISSCACLHVAIIIIDLKGIGICVKEMKCYKGNLPLNVET